MIQVAFAGHNRPHDLGRHKPVIEGLDAAFALLKQAGVHEARLLTGLATGADELAVAAWKRSGLGPIHAVFPFLDEPGDIVGPGKLAETATWLDGAAAQAQGRNPHLKQTRMIVETADLVIPSSNALRTAPAAPPSRSLGRWSWAGRSCGSGLPSRTRCG
jgi:hypothetical protein